MKITMENYSKLIDEAFKKLNWDHIMKYYDSHGEVEEDPTSTKKKRVRLNTKSITTIKKELKDLMKFAMESNINEIEQDNWIIVWSNKDVGYRLELIFTPTRAVVSDDEAATFDDDDAQSSDEIERDVLKDMLKKSIKEENYELSAVIHSRLKRLDKTIKSVSPNKKSDIY